MTKHKTPEMFHVEREHAGPVAQAVRAEDEPTRPIERSPSSADDARRPSFRTKRATGHTPRPPAIRDDVAGAPPVHDATRPTLHTADFGRLFDADSRRLAARVLRLAAGLCADEQLPDDLDARLEVLADLQRLCVAAEAEIDRLKLEVENEIVLRMRARARKARRRRDGG